MNSGAKRRASYLARRIVRLALLGTVALAVLALIRWQTTLSWLGSYLIYDQPLEHADLILVPGGNFWGPRVVRGAELGAQGFAPLVLISGPPYDGRPEGEFAVDFLVNKGFPRELFAVFAHTAKSTIGEALALRSELSRRRARRVIIVTSAYHSRRCALVFRMLCPGIRFISSPAPDDAYRAEDWWKQAGSRRIFFSEWFKIFGSLAIVPAYRVAISLSSGLAALKPILLPARCRTPWRQWSSQNTSC